MIYILLWFRPGYVYSVPTSATIGGHHMPMLLWLKDSFKISYQRIRVNNNDDINNSSYDERTQIKELASFKFPRILYAIIIPSISS